MGEAKRRKDEDTVVNGAYAALMSWLKTAGADDLGPVHTEWMRLMLDGLGQEWDRADEAGKLIVHVCAVEAAAIEGRPSERWTRPSLVDKAAAQLAGQLEPEQRRFLEALAEAPLRLYQVSRSNPGRSFAVVDLLDSQGALLTVMDSEFSRKLQGGEVFGMRLVEMPTYRVKSKGHFPVPPQYTGDMLDWIQQWAGLVGKDKAAAQGASIAGVIGRRWCETMIGDTTPEVFDDASGEQLVMITDYYELEDASTLSARMAQSREFVRTGHMTWQRRVEQVHVSTGTVVSDQMNDGKAMGASIYFDRETKQMCAFYKSERMASEGRQIFEGVAGATVRHVRRAKEKGSDAMREMRQLPEEQQERMAAENAKVRAVIGDAAYIRIVEEMYEQQYGDWGNTPLPALDGQTPRAACESMSGQERVRALIRMMVQQEERLAGQDGRKPVSLKFLWEQVGIKPG